MPQNLQSSGQRRASKLICGSFLALSVLLFVLIPLQSQSTNGQFYANPNSFSLRPIAEFTSSSLLAFEAMICIVGWIFVMATSAKRKTAIVIFSAAILVVTVAPAVLRNIDSLAQAVSYTVQNHKVEADEMFDFGGLKGLQIKDFGGEPRLPTTYVGKVKDGVDLIRQQGETNSIIAVLDFSNPFDVVRQSKPAKGAPTCWQLDFVYSRTVAPPATQVFDGVQAVLIPKQFGDGNQENLRTLFGHYGAYLDTNFVFSAQSQQWVLAKRKGR